jgi:hypothetical protein
MNNRDGHELAIGFFSSLLNGLPETVADAEARLREHERVLSQTQELGVPLRQHRNSLHFTHQLPPEVYILIFQHCLPHWRDVGYHENSSISCAFSWVCHYWRSAALSAPGLWSTPLFSEPNFASEMLHRARDAPLTVVTSGLKGSRGFSMLKTALESGSRIRRLVLNLRSQDSTLRELIAAFQGPALQLELLWLCPHTTEGRDLYWEKDRFLGDWAPRLRRLELVGCMLDPASALYKNLTHLLINREFNRQTIDVTSALQILAKACSLVDLDIRGITGSNELPPEKIVLLKLQHLTLTGRNVHVAASRLLGAVDMRCPATLHFGEHTTINVAEFAGLVRIAGSQAGITKALPFISLSVWIEDEACVHVEVGAQQHMSYLDFTANVDPLHLGSLLTVICEVIPVQDLGILDIHTWTSESALTEDEWLVVLVACPALERICVRSRTIPNFLLALSSQSEGRAAPLCPRLRELVLGAIKLVELVGERSILAHVHEFLKARHGEGRPLHTVDFQKCYHPDSGFVHALAPFAQINFVGCEEDDELISD